MLKKTRTHNYSAEAEEIDSDLEAFRFDGLASEGMKDLQLYMELTGKRQGAPGVVTVDRATIGKTELLGYATSAEKQVIKAAIVAIERIAGEAVEDLNGATQDSTGTFGA